MQVSTMAPLESSPIAKNDSRTGKYLAFQLGREEFAIQVLKVREILGNPGYYGSSPNAAIRQRGD